MAFSRTWNATYEGSPADTDQARQGALRIREVKQDVRERAEVDHFWQDDTHGGKHKHVRMRELASDPTSAADEGVLYVKDDGGGRTELYYIDSAGAITRITTAGTIPVTDGSVITAKLADGAVTTPKLADGAVTLAKLATDSVDQSKIVAAAVGQGELKTTIGDVSMTADAGNHVLPGGQYGFWPQLSASGGIGNLSSQFAPGYRGNSASLATHVLFQRASSGYGSSVGPAITARQRYIQASPPYESYRAGEQIPLFIFAKINKTTGDVVATYTAEDPPWANNGPTVVNPLGRIQLLARSRLRSPKTLEEEVEQWADIFDWIRDPRNAQAVTRELKREPTQEEKNRDMALIPHPFDDDPDHVVVVIDPCDSRFCRGLHARFIYGGDSIAELLHGGYMEISNTPIAGLVTPPNVLAVSARLKSNTLPVTRV